MAIVEVSGLRKTYLDGTEAVCGIDVEIQQGEFFGFLGPNGAGKSTTIKILVTLIPKSAGEVRVSGFTVGRDDKRIRSIIGYAAQDVSVDEMLTGRENLELSGRLYRLPRRTAQKRAVELLELIGLADVADKRAANYSGGMRRRLDLAQALVHDPPLLFLDEPTTGLDPQNRHALWEELRRLNRAGTTIFLTTQYMEEADALCRRLAVIDHGRIVAEGSPDALKARLGGEALTLTFPTDDPDVLKDLVSRGATVLRAVPGVGDVREGERAAVAKLVDSPALVLPRAFEALQRASVDARIAVSPPTLDDVFLSVTGHALRDEEGKPTGMMRRRSRARRAIR